ncbi:hypothetical protein ON010_g14135 [Phytophthora cinnamomi]|nr:hypothetical protein ON010_g14135 [Phytophthora cinnamomi]
MGKKSKSKSEAPPAAEPELPALEPEVVEAVQDQVKHQNASALADGFAQSAAFFGKKASYAPAVAEAPKEQQPEQKADDKKNKKKKEKKRWTK